MDVRWILTKPPLGIAGVTSPTLTMMGTGCAFATTFAPMMLGQMSTRTRFVDWTTPVLLTPRMMSIAMAFAEERINAQTMRTIRIRTVTTSALQTTAARSTQRTILITMVFADGQTSCELSV